MDGPLDFPIFIDHLVIIRNVADSVWGPSTAAIT